MRQKLALARALYHNPPVLLMDEPTSAMDPESARLVRDAIHGLRSANRAIIICTHNLSEAEELADKIAIIHQGRIIISGVVDELKTRLLGAPQFEVRLGPSSNGINVSLHDVVTITGQGVDWLRYQTNNPMQANPLVVQSLVRDHISVVGLSEVPRSLEKVYLQAINNIENVDGHVEKVEHAPSGGEDQHAG
jgi:ABC-2 type transport system ATP-binding protein